MKISPKICSECIMDETDPRIEFTQDGLCNYCQNFRDFINPSWQDNLKNTKRLDELSERIRFDGKGKEFDCIIGISGGLDSSYVAYVAKEVMNLRPLLLHVDAGWNSEQAVGNIEKVVSGLNVDLYTEVINWNAVKRMQLAFLRSGIPDQDLVQDAAFFSALYNFARKHNVRHVLTGSNYSTECCREPEEWGGYLGIDRLLFNDIWKKHGDGSSIKEFPVTDILTSKLWYQRVLGMKVHHPLNFIPYVKRDAEDELERKFSWQRFQHKHHESRFTRFYEDFWLPRRFGYDKRRAHFSSLIMTNQMTREDALARISKPEMSEHFLQTEFEYIAHKLGLNVPDLQALFEIEKRTYRDYSNKRWLISMGAQILRRLGQEKRYLP